jgi:hypothetical protein
MSEGVRFQPLPQGHFSRVGDTGQKTKEHVLAETRTVCRDYNNGWMSRLEQHATPILTALIGAANAGSDVTLHPSQAKVLARWATKTAWTSELASLGDHSRNAS